MLYKDGKRKQNVSLTRGLNAPYGIGIHDDFFHCCDESVRSSKKIFSKVENIEYYAYFCNVN